MSGYNMFYSSVRIVDHNDVDTIWRAYVNGIMQPISSEDIRRRSSLIESGNLVVYQGERYRDGEKWQKSLFIRIPTLFDNAEHAGRVLWSGSYCGRDQ